MLRYVSHVALQQHNIPASDRTVDPGNVIDSQNGKQ